MSITRVPDTEVRSDIRAILARHRIDMQQVQYRVTGGIVRLCGELLYLGGRGQAVELGVVEALERDLAAARGVRDVYFDLRNWQLLSPGGWRQRAKPARSGTGDYELIPREVATSRTFLS